MRVNDREVVTAVTDDVETENVSCLCEHCSCRLREQSRSDVNCGFPQCIEESAAGGSFTSQTAMKSSREILAGVRNLWFCRFIRYPVLACACCSNSFQFLLEHATLDRDCDPPKSARAKVWFSWAVRTRGSGKGGVFFSGVWSGQGTLFLVGGCREATARVLCFWAVQDEYPAKMVCCSVLAIWGSHDVVYVCGSGLDVTEFVRLSVVARGDVSGKGLCEWH